MILINLYLFYFVAIGAAVDPMVTETAPITEAPSPSNGTICPVLASGGLFVKGGMVGARGKRGEEGREDRGMGILG